MLALALSSGNTPDIYWEEQGMHEYDVVKKKKDFFPPACDRILLCCTG